MAKMRLFALPTVLAGLAVGSAHAADILVTNQAQFISTAGSAHPGDSIILQNGIWSGLNIGTQTINGTPSAPINIRAQTPGQVAIAGPGYIFGLSGSNYTVSG